MPELKCPQPGDIIAYISPDTGQPVPCLFLESWDDLTATVPIFAVTPFQHQVPQTLMARPLSAFRMRVQREIYPLQRKGPEIINATHVLQVPAVTKFFPEIHLRPESRNEAAVIVYGTIEADWLENVKASIPFFEDWDSRLLRHVSAPLIRRHQTAGFAGAAEEVEKQFDQLRSGGPVASRYGYLGGKNSADDDFNIG